MQIGANRRLAQFVSRSPLANSDGGGDHQTLCASSSSSKAILRSRTRQDRRVSVCLAGRRFGDGLRKQLGPTDESVAQRTNVPTTGAPPRRAEWAAQSCAISSTPPPSRGQSFIVIVSQRIKKLKKRFAGESLATRAARLPSAPDNLWRPADCKRLHCKQLLHCLPARLRCVNRVCRAANLSWRGTETNLVRLKLWSVAQVKVSLARSLARHSRVRLRID